MLARTTATRRGFSLIELVIVIVIIGIIAAIAIPRMSRGAEGATDAALQSDLAVMRNAIDLYSTEHGGVWPGNHGTSTFAEQMVNYSDFAGEHSATKNAGTGHIYGPYLRKLPPLPLGTHAGENGVKIVAATPAAEDGTAGIGWLMNSSTGEIWANATGYFNY